MNSPASSPSSNNHNNIDKFNFRSKPAQSMISLLQQQFRIKSLEISSHGRTGVIFVQTDKGSLVLKANNEGPIDEFFNRMAGLLSLNVAQSLCYCCSDLIFHKLIFQIQKYASRDQSFYARIKSRLNFPFYQIIQYIPSVSLAEVGKDRFQSFLLQDIKLYQLGMCIGFDLITNNSDRFKLLWSSDGNINNVLIQVKDHDAFQLHRIRDRSNTTIQLGGYIFIDHSGFLLDLKNPLAAKNFETYMKKVCDFQVNLVRSLTEEYEIPKQFQKLRDQIQLYTHYRLTDSDIKKISHGIVYMTNNFLQVFQSRALEQLYNSMKKGSVSGAKKRQDIQNNYWNQYWNEILGKINLNFLQEVFTKLAAIYSTYPEIIPQIIAQLEEAIGQKIKKTNFTQFEPKISGAEEEKLSLLDPGSNPTKDLIGTEQNLPIDQKEPRQANEPIQQVTNQNNTEPEIKNEIKPDISALKNVAREVKERKWRERLAKFVEKTSNVPSKQQQ